MADKFIPPEDGLALTFMEHFASTIQSAPAVYMLSAADATTISNTVAAFATAYSVATNPPTRTSVTVGEKDAARLSAEQVVRQYANLIRPNAGISDADKEAIGINPPSSERSPRNVPASSPLLSILGSTPGSQTVRYSDSTTPDSPAKPFGAANLQLFVAVGEVPTTDPTDALFYGAFTKNPIPVAFAPDQNGKQATYFARWADRKGQVGPWSLGVSMAIAA